MKQVDKLHTEIGKLVKLAKRNPRYIFNDPTVESVSIEGDESGVKVIVDRVVGECRLTMEKKIEK